MKVLSLYGQDLEQVRVIYQTEKTTPAAPRNLPPIAGRIAWARQLFRRTEAPMKVFKMNADILKVNRVIDASSLCVCAVVSSSSICVDITAALE